MSALDAVKRALQHEIHLRHHEAPPVEYRGLRPRERGRLNAHLRRIPCWECGERNLTLRNMVVECINCHREWGEQEVALRFADVLGLDLVKRPRNNARQNDR